ncbi:MAG: carboxypeptidase-like regulatory domain-containing protein [Acidobacteriota bacterium]|nr:carboxypeptidase-like regulatory domain-containing protein [Acidobacteriota bacterium]
MLAACRTGVPIVDTNPGPAVVTGTITGSVSSEDGKTGIAGRKVTAVNIESGENAVAVTSETGGYTLKVAPGRYRVNVELRQGEAVIRDKGTFTVGKSELQHDVDIRIGLRRAADRIYQPPLAGSAPIV